MGEKFDDRIAGASGFAALTFVFSTLFQAASASELSVLLSLRGVIYIIVGVIAVAFFIGVPCYVLQNDLAKLVARFTTNPNRPLIDRSVRLLGTGILIIEILLIYYLSKLFFLWYFNQDVLPIATTL